MKANQLVLFGGAAVTLSDGRGVSIEESLRKVGFKKAGKGYKGKQDAKGYQLDAKGNRVPTWDGGVDADGHCLDANNRPIVTARAITFAPVKSKDKEDMADLTGLNGAALKMHNLMVRTDAFQQAFAIVSGEASTGNYILPNNGFKVSSNGDITFKMKRTSERIIERHLSDDELLAEIAKRGLTAPAK